MKGKIMEEKEFLNEEEVVEEASPALEGIQELQEEEQEEAPQEKQEQIQPQPNESVRNLRLAKQKAERERDELVQRMQDIERRLLGSGIIGQISQSQAPQEEDLTLTINPDELAEGKHLLKVSKKMAKMENDFKEKIAQYEQKAAALAAESQLRIQYPDIDKVINSDNIALLRDEYPELAATINANPDIYSKSVAAYTMIKKLGIQEDPVANENQERIFQNSTKPRSSSSVSPRKSDSPLSMANSYAGGLTPAAKAQARKELEDILGY